MFDEAYDEEDQYYLAEYNLTNDKVQKEKQNLELKKNIEEYGKYFEWIKHFFSIYFRVKEKIRPTQKFQLENSKIQSYGNEPNNYNMNQNQLGPKQLLKNNKAINMSNQILDRAHQIDVEAKKKEKQVKYRIT